jgi:hypothetical protein
MNIRETLLTTAMGLALLVTPSLADDGLPRGWQGTLKVYSCQPDEWFRNSQGVWQNPTCVNLDGYDNPPAPAVIVTPPDEDEDEDPVDEDDDGDEDDEPEDDCACGPVEDTGTAIG